jgi:hypothetical protein
MWCWPRVTGCGEAVTGLGNYDLRFADTATGPVGFHGVVQETDTASPFALRLKVRHGRIVEAEAIVARPQEAGVPFVTAAISTNPVLNEIVPPALRSSRARMIELANGYFDTLQMNDGKLHTVFDDQCNRRENGYQTTNRDDGIIPLMKLGCADQFRLRARRFEVVDDERGLVTAAWCNRRSFATRTATTCSRPSRSRAGRSSRSKPCSPRCRIACPHPGPTARRAIHGETSCECCVRGRRSANVSPGKKAGNPRLIEGELGRSNAG